MSKPLGAIPFRNIPERMVFTVAKTTLEERYEVLRKKQVEAGDRFRRIRVRQFHEFLFARSPFEIAEILAQMEMLVHQDKVKDYANRRKIDDGKRFESLDEAARELVCHSNRRYRVYECEWRSLWDMFMDHVLTQDVDVIEWTQMRQRGGRHFPDISQGLSHSEFITKWRNMLSQDPYTDAAVRAKRLTQNTEAKIDKILVSMRVAEREIFSGYAIDASNGVRNARNAAVDNKPRVMW